MESGDPDGLRLDGAVVTVRDLVRSREFYCEVLGLAVELGSGDAVLLAGAGESRLVLRALPRAPQVMGSIGVQYLAWVAPSAEALERIREALEQRGALTDTTSEGGIGLVEGRDPDGIRVVVVWPHIPGPGLTELPDRVYGY